MIKKLPYLLLTVVFLLPCVVRAEKLTLKQTTFLAQKQSENLQLSREQIEEIYFRVQEIKGAVYPSLYFNAQEIFQDKAGGAFAESDFTKTLQPQVKFKLDQPIYSGFKDRDNAKVALLEKEKVELNLKRTELLLFEETAIVFYAVVQHQTNLSNIEETLSLMQDRIQELKKREQIGKSRRSEILNVESQIAQVRAQKEQVQANLQVALEMLSLLTGIPSEKIELDNSIDKVEDVKELNQFLNQVQNRSDIQTLLKDVSAQEYRVKIAKAAHYPVISGSGNYYLKRSGFQETIDWDARLELNLPLFEGSAVNAKIKQTQSGLRQSQVRLSYLRRQVQSQVRQNYLRLKYSIAQQNALQLALQKSRESYQLQVQEYRYGLVNNLDVLEALTQAQNAKQNYDRMLIETKINQIKLQISVEEMPF